MLLDDIQSFCTTLLIMLIPERDIRRCQAKPRTSSRRPFSRAIADIFIRSNYVIVELREPFFSISRKAKCNGGRDAMYSSFFFFHSYQHLTLENFSSCRNASASFPENIFFSTSRALSPHTYFTIATKYRIARRRVGPPQVFNAP